jgi:hypothetical protein
MQDFEQQDMFVHIGKIAGVILMTVLHGNPAPRAARLYTVGKERIMSKSLNFLLLVALLGEAAIAVDTPPTPRGIAPPTRIPDVETMEPVASVPAGEPISTAQIPRSVRHAVVADAARRFNVAESAVVIGRAEQLTWSDGSLGCPEPGRTYAQVLVPGFRLVAITSAGELTYHTDSRGNAVTCASRVPSRATGAGG